MSQNKIQNESFQGYTQRNIFNPLQKAKTIPKLSHIYQEQSEASPYCFLANNIFPITSLGTELLKLASVLT